MADIIQVTITPFRPIIRYTMKTIGNIIWIIFGGLPVAIEYFIASVGLMVTIIGIPFGLQTLKIGMFILWPFGTEVVHKKHQLGCLNFVMNIIWILIGGFWIFLTHILLGILFCITIIGIPFGYQQFKLARLAFTPFGKELR